MAARVDNPTVAFYADLLTPVVFLTTTTRRVPRLGHCRYVRPLAATLLGDGRLAEYLRSSATQTGTPACRRAGKSGSEVADIAVMRQAALARPLTGSAAADIYRAALILTSSVLRDLRCLHADFGPRLRETFGGYDPLRRHRSGVVGRRRSGPAVGPSQPEPAPLPSPLDGFAIWERFPSAVDLFEDAPGDRARTAETLDSARTCLCFSSMAKRTDDRRLRDTRIDRATLCLLRLGLPPRSSIRRRPLEQAYSSRPSFRMYAGELWLGAPRTELPAPAMRR